MYKKYTIITNIEVEEIVSDGKCLAKKDGLAVFINGKVAPGDVVDLKLTKVKKNFIEGTVEKITKHSDLRQDVFCSHFDICGGCKWQHIGYPTQLHYKQKHVIDSITHIGKTSPLEFLPIAPSEDTEYYRNKLEFTFSNKRWLTIEQIASEADFDRNGLGFHIPKLYDKVVDIEHCYLQGNLSNDIRNAVKSYALEHHLNFMDIREKSGLLRTLTIRTSISAEIMLIFQFFRNDEADIKALLDFVNSKFKIDSLNYVINSKANDTFHDLEVVTYSGKPFIEEKLEDLTFRVSPKSFYQTNSKQTQTLYSIARNFAELTGDEVVYDLYTGTGTIANFVAKKAKKVVGIEYVEAAIEDAKINSEINNISNTVFYAGDMKDILTEHFIHENGKPDVIITDPPRAGMHEDVVKTILNAEAQKLVYVSCNPATQARDIELLSSKYTLVKLQPVDMFPHTQHVESIALLQLKSK